MVQRVVIAKTLIHDPEVLLLDEPASGLDPKARIELREVLKQLGQMGKTILISSHILTELSDFCNAVGIMEKGRMVIDGRIEEILERISPHRSIAIGVLDGARQATKIAAQDEHVKEVSTEGDKIRVKFVGDDEALAALLSRLVGSGIRVCSFSEEKEDLEDIFLKVGAYELG
jgi:ABC-2 type transport system ATP-binding protein